MPSIKFRSRLSLAFAALVALVFIQAGFVYVGSERVNMYAQHSRLASDILSELLELSANKQRLRVWASQRLTDAHAPDEVRDRALAAMQASAASLRVLTRRDLALWQKIAPIDDVAVPSTAAALVDSSDLLEENIAEVQSRLGRLTPLSAGAQSAAVWRELNEAFDITRERDLREIVNDAIDHQRRAVPVARLATESGLADLRIKSIALAVLTLAAAALMALHLNWRLQRPIDRLLTGTQALRAGNMDHRMEVDSDDEFDQVALHFNSMAAELQQHRSNAETARRKLEDAVASRTAELQTAHVTLQRIDEKRRQLFADLSHELRTPATAIRGEAEIALRGADKPQEEYKLALQRIVGGVKQLARVIDDLMLIARAEVDQLVMQRGSVDLAPLIGEATEQTEALGALHGVHVRLEPPSAASTSPLRVQADPDRLRQVLMIVLDNAVRYSHAGGVVQITWQAVDDVIDIFVQDQGIGIESHELPEVFQRFARGKRAREHRADGTGIGLSIAKAIVTAHEGHIDVASEPGVGTTVHIRLQRIGPGLDQDALEANA